jgi:hypothetical protein
LVARQPLGGFGAEDKLKRIDMAGGPAQALCDVPQIRGGTWSQHDVIVYGTAQGGLFRVPAWGEAPIALTALDPVGRENNHRGPGSCPMGNVSCTLPAGWTHKNARIRE